MKRKGIKIVSYILTISSGASILMAYCFTVLIFTILSKMPNDGEANYGAFFFLIVLIMLVYILMGVLEIAVAAIIMNAIDIKKSKREESKYTINKVFLTLNIVFAVLCVSYPFVIGLLKSFL